MEGKLSNTLAALPPHPQSAPVITLTASKCCRWLNRHSKNIAKRFSILIFSFPSSFYRKCLLLPRFRNSPPNNSSIASARPGPHSSESVGPSETLPCDLQEMLAGDIKVRVCAILCTKSWWRESKKHLQGVALLTS